MQKLIVMSMNKYYNRRNTCHNARRLTLYALHRHSPTHPTPSFPDLVGESSRHCASRSTI